MRSFFRNSSPFYEKLPTTSTLTPGTSTPPTSNSPRSRSPNPTSNLRRIPLPFPRRLSRLATLLLTSLLLSALLVTTYRTHHLLLLNREPTRARARDPYPWESFPPLTGYYSGLRNLVPGAEYLSEQGWRGAAGGPPSTPGPDLGRVPPLAPVKPDPYPLLDDRRRCFLDGEKGRVPAPEGVWAYPGLPRNMTAPGHGGYEVVGLESGGDGDGDGALRCWERWGRWGAYGYGYPPAEGGLGLGNWSERVGVEELMRLRERDGEHRVDWRGVDWGVAQRDCVARNRERFGEVGGRKRTAYVLRTYTGYRYETHQLLHLRAMVNELALLSGGEYDVHLLVEVKDRSLPIFEDEQVYRRVVEESVPREFRGLVTLWNEKLIEDFYPSDFPSNRENHSNQPIHGVYRSGHFALMWFAQQHPEYDSFWNWEMDLRFTGHYYELHESLARFARAQPRKGLWERSARFYIPGVYGPWENFSAVVESETKDPVWGPPSYPGDDNRLPPPKEAYPPTSWDEDQHQWGVGEEADFISLMPLFDPEPTNWVFRYDLTGWDTELPAPPRRVAIVTAGRLSKRLLDIMHAESRGDPARGVMAKSAFPEMYPPTIALQHGLKAVYAPHPVFMDREWDPEYMDRILNRPSKPHESPFGWGEHNMLGASFYYNAQFGHALYRRWMGGTEELGYEMGVWGGGREEEEGVEGWWDTRVKGMYEGSGRMCLRGTLVHPVKREVVEEMLW